MNETDKPNLKAPCRDCGKRTAVPNCHAKCEKYLAFAKQQEEEYEKRRIIGTAVPTQEKRIVEELIRREIKRRSTR